MESKGSRSKLPSSASCHSNVAHPACSAEELTGLLVSSMTLQERPSSRRLRASQSGSVSRARTPNMDYDSVFRDFVDEDNESDERKEAWIHQATQLDEKFYLKDKEVSTVTEEISVTESKSLSTSRDERQKMEVVLTRTTRNY